MDVLEELSKVYLEASVLGPGSQDEGQDECCHPELQKARGRWGAMGMRPQMPSPKPGFD